MSYSELKRKDGRGCPEQFCTGCLEVSEVAYSLDIEDEIEENIEEE